MCEAAAGAPLAPPATEATVQEKHTPWQAAAAIAALI